jgi:short-subunit dehydrogenase
MTTILISGASSGIGKALAENYACKENTLLLFGRDKTRLAEITALCKKRGAKTISVAINVCEQKTIAAKLFELDKKYPIDLVIANAGISAGSGSAGEGDEKAGRIMDVNVNGVLNIIYPLIPLMQKRQKGQIAIMSSIASLHSLPSAPAYSASKVCVRFFGEALRAKLKKDNIKVNVICPGYVKTPMTAFNKFPMPFIVTAEKAAQIIVRGLDKNKARIAFPKIMYFALWLINVLPLWLTDPIFEKLPDKE